MRDAKGHGVPYERRIPSRGTPRQRRLNGAAAKVSTLRQERWPWEEVTFDMSTLGRWWWEHNKRVPSAVLEQDSGALGRTTLGVAQRGIQTDTVGRIGSHSAIEGHRRRSHGATD